tara:strand:+ start:120 stop:434 length:315 start_codon:yes stop_codon:yes gene_type:complete
MLTSILLGLCSALALAGLYGWGLYVVNADLLASSSWDGWSDAEVALISDFLWKKTITMGASIFGAMSIAMFLILTIWDVSIQSISDKPKIPKKLKAKLKKKLKK